MKKDLKQYLLNLLVPYFSEDISLESDTYWNKSKEDHQIRDYSHWRGVGRWGTNEKWSKIGRTHYRFFEDLCELTKTSRQRTKTMVEWGPGGGSNATIFSKKFSIIFGIDISEPNLQECSKQLRNIDFDGFHPILIKTKNPESSRDRIPNNVDFFLSTAVFQHFPSKAYGIRILKLAYSILRNKGIALVQIRYDNGRKKYKPKKHNYKKNVITFTSYKIEEFWDICNQVGLTPIYIHLDPSINYAYFFLQKE